MAAKVGPMKSDNYGNQQPPGPQSSKGVAVSIHSIQHHDEAEDAHSGSGAARGNVINKAAWVKKKIKMRICNCYIPAEENDICQCGYSKMEHRTKQNFKRSPPEQSVDIPTDRLKWKCKKHTKTIPTNAFGEIEFVGLGGNIGKFVRVDKLTEMPIMLDMMMKVWELEKPNLLISVTGGAKNFIMKPRLRDVFRRGLMKAAQSTGAWIITGGTHAGVMKHVGEAVKDYGMAYTNQKPVITIGLVPWGVIQNRDTLENKQWSWPVEYYIDELPKEKESFLDPNHSHFIMVDDGTQHKFATEITFRANLEKEVSQRGTNTGDVAVRVPIILLVLEGGPGTLKTVTNALKTNTPALIVKGSGRAADILAHAFKNSKPVESDENENGEMVKKTKKCMDSALEKEIKEQMKHINFCKEEEMTTHIERIKHCLAKSDLIHIFEWDTGTGALDFDVAILKALLRANKNQVMDQLKLALAWNRIDIVKSEIFADDKSWLTLNLDDVMLSAIQLNRVDFVKLFLDNGVSLKEFLKTKRLLQLYKYGSAKHTGSSRSVLTQLLKKMRRKKKAEGNNGITLKEVGELMQDLLGDYYVPYYISESRYADAYMEDGKIKEGLASVVRIPLGVELPPAKKVKEEPDFVNPAQELFLWSVLNNRQDMAKLFWLQGKDAIAAALVAHALLNAMSERTEDIELLAQLTENTNEFMNLAIGVLKECYSTGEKKTQYLLTKKLSEWGNTSCILIAVKANNRQFISQTACQDLFNSIWMGGLTQENGTFRLLVCIAIPVLIPFLIAFVKNEDGEPVHGEYRTHLSEQNQAETSLALPSQRSRLDSEGGKKYETKPDGKCRKIAKKFSSFYLAPVIIFYHNMISYAVFLCLYSYVLISTFEPIVSEEEIVLIVWVITFVVEEIRQVSTIESTTVKTKLQSYIKDVWNVLDAIAILLFVIGMILRAIPHEETFEAARVFLGVSLVTFFLRLLHIFSVNKNLGPKLVMIMHMVRDLVYFVVILMVFVLAYAIASYAILFPKTELTLDNLKSIFWRPYWNIYGELMLDEIQGKGCTKVAELYKNSTMPRCPTESGKYFVPVLMGAYMLMCYILLLNLLIAMFSYTFKMVQVNTDMHWCFQRYRLINEYYTRPFLAPPLILIGHAIGLITYILKKCGKASCCQTTNAFVNNVSNERELRKWEDVIADTFHHKRELADLETTEYRVKTTSLRLEQLVNKMDGLQEQQKAVTVTTDDTESVQKTLTEPNLVTLGKRIETIEEQLKWIVESLSEHHLGARRAIPEVNDARAEEKKQEEKKTTESRALVCHMLEGQVKFHTRSRFSPYPDTRIQRFKVPDDKVPWDVEYPVYNPPHYTSPIILAKPNWADNMDLYSVPIAERKLQFNAIDSVTNTKRFSYAGNYPVKQGIPLNPMGRTGVLQRGLLGRWGPNHVVDLVITRWKFDENNKKMLKDGKPQFEFVAVKMTAMETWALPESILTPGHPPTKHLKIKFSDEALNLFGDNRQQKKEIKKQKENILKKGKLIHKGYADDPRNTDNAWVESTVYLYQDKEHVLRHFSFKLKATTPDLPATWLTASSKLSLHGAHGYFLKLVAEMLDASF
ncbi:hypothetical protein CHS0354_019664 [Potamilus streckersoni]|uniref:Transient receptor potential cation channel subfamily M member 2 n=1 Tax=Potamilus streckersoni TaxID=2493646 RepID=A0AAE0W9F1_9BIVA|nr:hypothetical protein CHS0354_019664 [Potamilus streckersoni]